MLTRTTGSTTTAVAVAAALALSSCTSGPEDEATPGVTDDTVTIGTHQPLTGPASAGYSAISAATSAYFEYVNDNGGVHGREIEYLVEDDAYSPQETQTAVRKLVETDEVFAIVNGLGTDTHASVLEYLDEEGVPDLFVSSGSPDFNQPNVFENTFGFNADYVTEGAALAQYAAERHPGARVCFLGQDDDFGDDVLEGVETVVGGEEIIEIQVYSNSNDDLSQQIGALMAADCEVNILGTINPFTALALGTAAEAEWFPRWYAASVGSDYSTLVEYLGAEGAPLLEGLVATNFLPSGPDDEWVELFTQINEQYNDGAPFTSNTILGMSVGYTFAEALAAAGADPTRASLIEAVESGSVTGNSIVPLEYSDDDHSGYTTVGITVIEDGVQDYVGTTYNVDVGQVTEVETAPVPLENNGIPTG